MSDVIRRLHRLRKHAEREAKVQLMEAMAATQRSEERLNDTNRSLEEAREAVDSGDYDLAAHHSWALRTEMARRRQEQDFLRRQRLEAKRREVVRERATEARTLERIAELRDAERDQAQGRKDRMALDEAGSRGWWVRAE